MDVAFWHFLYVLLPSFPTCLSPCVTDHPSWPFWSSHLRFPFQNPWKNHSIVCNTSWWVRGEGKVEVAWLCHLDPIVFFPNQRPVSGIFYIAQGLLINNPLKVKVFVVHLRPTLCDPMDSILPGSSVHGIVQARILEWEAIPFSRQFSWPRDWTQAPALEADSLSSESPGNHNNPWVLKC